MTRSALDMLADLAGARGARANVARTLAATERWPAAELEKQQLLKLSSLLDHARRTVPYYAAFPPLPSRPLTLDDVAQLPILERPVVRDRLPDLLSTDPPPGHHVVHEANSSGSTGRHVTVRIDRASRDVGGALAMRAHGWHGRDTSLKAAALRAVGREDDVLYGTDLTWSPEGGQLVVKDVHTPVREQLAWLVREAPVYLATYPTLLEALLRRAETEGVTLPSLREVGTFGEVVPPGLREALRRVWNVPMVDAYSAIEAGFIAIQCPAGVHYHVQSENVLVEVLRNDGSRAKAGESGRVVLTPLHNYAMPLLRYSIGDFAVVGEPCACGLGLPVLERILGRSHNMMRLPSGDMTFPRYGSIVLGKLFPLRQFRLVQTSVEKLVLQVVPERPLTRDEEQRLCAMILDVIGYPFELTLSYVEAIARSPGGKFEDFVCEVQPIQNSQCR